MNSVDPPQDPGNPDENTVKLPTPAKNLPAGWQDEKTLKLGGSRGEAPTLHEPPHPEDSLQIAMPEEMGEAEHFGSYRILGRIGEGGMGVVYKVRDMALGRDCALRVLSEEALGNQADAHGFLEVARKLSTINHPNLTSIYAIEQDEKGRTGVVMELIEGRSLEWLSQSAQLSSKPTDWVDYLIQAARALEAAWKLGVIHRDIKPSNIFLTADGLIKVGDFGLVRPASTRHDYQSPEARRQESVDVRSDMFSLAASFYHLITGQLPLPEGTTTKPIALSKITSRCPLRLAEILDRMLTATPRRRFRSYRQLLKALEPLLPGTLEPLPVYKRIEALFFFDMVGYLGLFVLVNTVLAIAKVPSTLLQWISQPISIILFYYCYRFLMRRFAQTVGKMVFRAEVHGYGGESIHSLTLSLRFLLTYGPLLLCFELIRWQWWETQPGRIAGAIVLVYLLSSTIVAWLSKENRMLHDYLLGTWVVRRGKVKTAGEDNFVQPASMVDLDLESARQRGERLGRTILLDKLGQGGMGQVFRGYDEQLHRQVAVKVLSEELDPDSDFYDRFVREARILANLSHPNLVQVYSYGQDAEKHYFAMELIQGRSLSQVLSLEGALNSKTATKHLIQACHGLEAAQQCGVIHRDVKPSNMILSDNGVLKMVDFGLAKGAATKDISSELTKTGIIMGTPHYMSPEQGRGDPVDHRSDIYSLGATTFHLLTGHYPYLASSPMGIVVKHITDPLPTKKLQLRAPEGLVRIIQKMMEKDPAERYQSYRQVIEDLERLMPSQFIRAGFWSRIAALMFDVVFTFLGELAGLATICTIALWRISRESSWSGDPDVINRGQRLWETAWDAWWAYPLLMLFGSLPPIYTTIKLWRDMATPGMAKVDLRLVRKSGMPLLALQRFCWFFLVPELYLLWGVIISVSFTSDLLGTLVFLALFFLLPGASIICSLRYGKSIPEFLTRSYLIYD